MAKQRTEAEEKQYVEEQRAKIAKGGFFHNAAVWLLSRFPLTKHKYQNWTKGRRILIGWLLWLICLPIIPAVAIAVWYFNDPEGFKKSPWAKGLIALFIAWLGAFGWIATNPSEIDQNGRFSPIQTQPDGETKIVNDNPAAVATEAAKQKVANQKESKDSKGRKFENCTEAFEAGVFNIRRSNASYDKKLDRDGDGIACEK